MPKLSEIALKNPYNKLDIGFFSQPITFPEEYREVLEDSGIYAYRFGGIRYSILPNKTGKYTQEYDTKELVGVIKKDEFGKVQKYSILMDKFSYRIPPKFYRDIVFSDMVLRNSENTCGYVGGIRRNREDLEYGYKICYDDLNLNVFLRALYFNDKQEFVKTVSNFSKVKNYNDARNVIIKKLEHALDRLFAGDEKEEKIIGDD